MDLVNGFSSGHREEKLAKKLLNYQKQKLKLNVTCRWHALLDVSWVGSVANSAKVTVLRSDPEPLLS
jgi:hypothetical protein